MNLIELDNANFDKTLGQGSMLTLFWADWCPLCIILIETFKTLAENFDGKLPFCMVNFDENKDLSSKFNVLGVPTVIAFSGGEIIDVRAGYRETDEYVDMIYHLVKKRNESVFS
jgi:thioredoxin 1